VVSATGKAKKATSIVATPPQPMKDDERKAQPQLLGKRSLSSIYDYGAALPFDADESDKKGMKLWRAWQDAKEAMEAAECNWFAHQTKHYNAKQAKLDAEE